MKTRHRSAECLWIGQATSSSEYSNSYSSAWVCDTDITRPRLHKDFQLWPIFKYAYVRSFLKQETPLYRDSPSWRSRLKKVTLIKAKRFTSANARNSLFLLLVKKRRYRACTRITGFLTNYFEESVYSTVFLPFSCSYCTFDIHLKYLLFSSRRKFAFICKNKKCCMKTSPARPHFEW